MTSLLWLRRDLRLHDHAALATALAAPCPVQPVFVFDTAILAQFPNPRDRRLVFLAETLCQMDAALAKRGGRLLVLHGNAREVIPALASALSATALYSAEDFEPATRTRDAAVKAALPTTVRFVQALDHLMRAPQAMLKSNGTPYKVFTPFYKLWRADMAPPDWAAYTIHDAGRYANATNSFAAADAAGLFPLNLDHGADALLAQIGYHHTPDPLWRVDNARERLQQFIAHKLAHYPTARDNLASAGTSQISPYLRFGLVSIRECVQAAIEAGNGEKWISELAWREFYAAILYHFPEVATEEFSPHYRHGAIPWSHDEHLKTAFFTGKTGYPIVDAAVRELLETGTMHNRARMIVASFATKDLLLDWRIGEAFFSQHLMDYDLASNNGGWQWAASTGTDAAPYFRIFNPTLQSQRFDPDGSYIRRHVPELQKLSAREIHAPWQFPLTKPTHYPAPIVDHATAKERAVFLFRNAGRSATMNPLLTGD